MKQKSAKKKFDFGLVRQLFPYIWKEKWLFLAGLTMMITTSGLKLLDPLIIAHILDNIVPEREISQLYLYAGLFVAVIFVSGILTYFQIILLAKMGIKIITRLKYQVFDHFLKLPVSFFDKNPVGELIARVESDCENVRQLFSDLSVMILGNLFFFSGMLAVMFIRQLNITLILLLPIAVIVVSVFYVARYLGKFYRRVRELNADITGVISEYVQGISIVQLFNREDKVMEILDNKGKDKKRIDSRAMFTEYSFWGVYGFLLETVIVVLLIYLMVPQILIGAITIGTLIVFIQYTQRLFWPLMMISENINQVQRAFASLQRIFGILALKEETHGLKNSFPAEFNEKIEFRNVWFQYKKDEWVLKDVSFTINKGEKVALVGASGSGKTTTVSLLCLYYLIQKGGIYVDGVNLNDLEMKEWREKIGLVLQDIYLFPGDIRENIRIYNNDISEKDIEDALQIVRASDFVKRQPEGIFSEIKERGQNISVGEKQLLSFARAIVFQPELIILDEATASIDVRTEARIQQAIETVLKNKTAVIVAHRLSSVVNADKILLFHDGRIVAQGTHNELLAGSPEYKKLVELQFLHQEEAG